MAKPAAPISPQRSPSQARGGDQVRVKSLLGGSAFLCLRVLLALLHERLALFFAMKSLGVGFLRAFERRCAPRLFGLRSRSRSRSRGWSGRSGGLRECGTHQEQGYDGGRGGARRQCHHGKHLGLKRGATSRRDAERRMNEAGWAVSSATSDIVTLWLIAVVSGRRCARMGSQVRHAPRRP
jgi:hypothetical protein